MSTTGGQSSFESSHDAYESMLPSSDKVSHLGKCIIIVYVKALNLREQGGLLAFGLLREGDSRLMLYTCMSVVFPKCIKVLISLQTSVETYYMTY